ncbi:helix-turn-helix transcriptional regulator [Fictibacillus enclensis]|uniref:helix-turn-helix domain-containing protein n=1 Tax=Fictibacillus enclensis TaxID=1017270 RepID=UPI0025A2588B|nr:helix-turn-helix transcriptional regulator [Fictibacillus enclensis]MDM5336105.1 helix-turn-helix transcriptional regulator [Fictibacillus enclensis]
MVGQRIRYYRKTNGLTQEELAQGICSVSYLSKIEKGDAKSSEEVINLLCEKLGISSEEVDSNEILEMLNEWNMMMVNRRFDEAEEFFETVQEKMQHVSEPELILRYELFLARKYIVSNEQDLTHTDEILSKIKELQEQLTQELKFYYNQILSMYYYFKTDYKNALSHLQEAEKLMSVINIEDMERAVVFYQLALCFGQIFRISSVNYYAYKAINIFDKEYNYSRSADCQILLAISNRRVRNYVQAEYHLNQALKYSKTFKDDFTSGVIFHNLGFLASCRNEHQKSIQFLEKSLSFKKDLSDVTKIATIFLMASEYYQLEDYNSSEKWLTQGQKILNKYPHHEYEYHYRILMLKIKKDHNELISYLAKEAVPYFDKQHLLESYATYSELLADLYFEHSQYKKASLYYRVSNNARKNIL